MRHFESKDVRAALRYEDLIPAMAKALADYSAGRAVQPVRTVIPVVSGRGFLFVMPALSGDALGAKLVSFFPKNLVAETHHATIQLFSAKTGEPIAMMDGSLITEMRTAAVSAVATDRLARADARVLAILGAGVQARGHLDALRRVRPFKEVRVWSPNSAKQFAKEHKIKAARSAEAAVKGADVIVVATTSQEPVLRGEWVAPGAHVNSVGAARPDWRELDDDFVRRATLFVDSKLAALKESGDVIAAGRIDGELGQVVEGKHPGRTNRNQVTWFKSLGMAVEDVVAAEIVYNAKTGKAKKSKPAKKGK